MRGGKNAAFFGKGGKLLAVFIKLALFFGNVIFALASGSGKLADFLIKLCDAFAVVLDFVFKNGAVGFHFADSVLILRNGDSALLNGGVYPADFLGDSAHALLRFVVFIIKRVIFRLICGNGPVLLRKLGFKIVKAAHPKGNFKGLFLVGKLNKFFCLFGLLQKGPDPFLKSGKYIPQAQKVIVRFAKAAFGFLLAIAKF